MNSETLRKKIIQTPSEIKTWLGSDDAVNHIKKFGSKFNIGPTKQSVIPKLILRIGIKDLEPKYFAGQLSMELEINKEKAMTITAEIKKNIFLPIKREFLDYGIEIERLDEFEIPAHEAYKNEPAEEIIALKNFDENDSSQEKIISIKEDLSEVKLKEKEPLIIHEEKTSGAEEMEIQKRQKIFSSPFRFFQSKQNQAEERSAVKVRIETPKDATRVVHYSEFRTPVAPLAGNEEFISLDKFEKEAVAEAPIALTSEQIKPTLQAKTFFSWPLKPATQPQKSQEENKLNNQPPNQPKLDGNLIDLR